MTEDQNDQTNEGPVDDPSPETAPNGTPETTSQAAIPLPAVTPPASEQPLPLPQQPDTPPMGVCARSGTTSQLDPAAGHLRHGRPGRQPDAGCSTGILIRFSTAHRPRGPHMVGAAGGRHGERDEQPPRPQRTSGRSRRAGGPGRRLRHRPCDDEQRRKHAGLQPDFGQLAPAFEFRNLGRLELLRGFRLLGESLRGSPSVASATQGALATRAAAAQVHRARRVRVTSTPLRPRSTRAWSTSTRPSATSRSRRRARASCSRPAA